jgi:phosphopentomutase
VVTGFALPTMASLGLGHLTPLTQIGADPNPIGQYGKLAEQSKGKDTTTGHWEMMGIVLDEPFPTYLQGFPPSLIQAFIEATGCQAVLGNCPASGTTILDQLGPQHQQTGHPIVYTSADSVFQIAAHTDHVPLPVLYQWCQAARQLLVGQHEVSRVIARPFTGTPGHYKRLGGDRRDYAVPPKGVTMLDTLKAFGCITLGVGKIEDIFCSQGLTHAIHTDGNTHGLQVLSDLVQRRVPLDQLTLQGKPLCDYAQPNKQLHFINLVDTDMNFGHRRDPEGYATALMEIDTALASLLPALQPTDLLLLTADHGCDPTAPGSDHTREYVPLLAYSPSLPPKNLGIGDSFSVVGTMATDWLNQALFHVS